MTERDAVTVASSAADLRRKHLLPALSHYYEEPLLVESGSGLRVTDADGRSYLDFFGGILTVSLGHCSPRVVDAVNAQLRTLGHVSTLYTTFPMLALAERLARLAPGRLNKSIFTTSGTEANDTAVVLAQVYTGVQEVVALRHGYAGRSTLAQSLTGQATWRAVPSQVGSVKHAMAPYCYRCPLGLSYPSCEMRCARDIEEVIQTTTVGAIAGFLAEPILGIGGFVTPPPEYFEIAVDIVRKYGGVFICDEVQTGFGRTGGHMFGIGHWGVEPEIMTMAKGIANGMPLGATIATDEVADAFTKLTISTFGGNPVSCAAANATIDMIEEEDLAARATEMGELLRGGLEELKQRHPTIGDVRGMGLMQALELVVDETAGDRTPDPLTANRFLEETRRRGLLIGKSGLYGNVIRIAPPLTVGAGEVHEALAILDRSLAAR